MTLLALLLAGLGLADLIAGSGGRLRCGFGWLASAGLIVVVFILGQVQLASLLYCTISLAAVILLWMWLVRSSRLCVAGILLLVASALGSLAAQHWEPSFGGKLGRWYRQLPVAHQHGVPFTHFALAVGTLLFLQQSSNQIVRSVLRLTKSDQETMGQRLRGGRLIGPLERTFVFVAGLSGALTAATVIVAAKGLLRFPEIRSADGTDRRIDELTEYLIVGSMASWLIPLLCLLLLKQ